MPTIRKSTMLAPGDSSGLIWMKYPHFLISQRFENWYVLFSTQFDIVLFKFVQIAFDYEDDKPRRNMNDFDTDKEMAGKNRYASHIFSIYTEICCFSIYILPFTFTLHQWCLHMHWWFNLCHPSHARCLCRLHFYRRNGGACVSSRKTFHHGLCFRHVSSFLQLFLNLSLIFRNILSPIKRSLLNSMSSLRFKFHSLFRSYIWIQGCCILHPCSDNTNTWGHGALGKTTRFTSAGTFRPHNPPLVMYLA